LRAAKFVEVKIANLAGITISHDSPRGVDGEV
jgi:hypothetical protein